ncbi:hypothetical protein HanXRQr2_Chr03g0122861 [Helianthus annuus]|nr:hypothetical protein HanXRQr2_Chr03g0122861 [Helianthus annuus]KAJ0944681.1 hypothetical protein HanPSC8_Chr03g0119571 [Helianthus annuus]
MSMKMMHGDNRSSVFVAKGYFFKSLNELVWSINIHLIIWFNNFIHYTRCKKWSIGGVCPGKEMTGMCVTSRMLHMFMKNMYGTRGTRWNLNGLLITTCISNNCDVWRWRNEMEPGYFVKSIRQEI